MVIQMSEPNILMFEVSGGFYIYDVNRNGVIQVSEGLYQYIANRDGQNDTYEEMIHELEKKGYLSINRVEEIKHPLTDYIDDYVEENINAMILQITQNCNMRCRYCAFSGDGSDNRRHSHVDMPEQIALDAINFLYKHSKYSDKVSLSFYGGEPLLKFDLLKKCTKYCKELMPDKNIDFLMTTNGTIMTNEIMDFLATEKIILTISVDGPQQSHDKYRRFAGNGDGTYEHICKNLYRLKEKYPDYYQTISFNAVVDRDSDMTEISTFFEREDLFRGNKVLINGVSDSYIDMQYVETKEYLVSLRELLFKQLIDQMRGTENNQRSQMMNAVSRFSSSMGKTDKLAPAMHHQGPCIPGRGKLFVDVEGKIRPCEKVSEHTEELVIGNIYDGFDHKKIENNLNIGRLTEEECKNCWAIRLCKQCVLCADNIDGLSREKKLAECVAQKRNIKNLLKDFVVLKRTKLM